MVVVGGRRGSDGGGGREEGPVMVECSDWRDTK